MRRKLVLFLACLAACDLNIDIGSRDAAGSSDASVEDPFCPEPAQLTAFEVRLDALPVTDPTCWIDGVVPTQHTLPEEIFNVLVASSATTSVNFGNSGGVGGGGGSSLPNIQQQLTFAIDGLGPQQLGEAPVIQLGAAMEGFEWRRTQTARVSPDAKEVRFTWARFEFDRLDLAQTAGRLLLRSIWSCTPGGASCTAAPDRASCNVTRPFVARRLADVPEPWVTPSTELVDGGEPYLVTMDLGALSRGMTCSPEAELTDSTPNLRALEVWQFAPNLIRVPPRTVAFPVAPVLVLESNFHRDPSSRGIQLHGRELLISPDALERRTTTASLSGRHCGASAFRSVGLDAGTDGGLAGAGGGSGAGFSVQSAELVLESRYECIGDGCSSVQSDDRGTCRVVVPWLPMLLPRPFVTGP